MQEKLFQVRERLPLLLCMHLNLLVISWVPHVEFRSQCEGARKVILGVGIVLYGAGLVPLIF